MREHLSGIEARDRGITELCAQIAPAGHRVVITHTTEPVEDLGARLTPDGPVDDGGRPLWIYGSTLPRELIERSSKVQVHEPLPDDEAPAWFDRRFPRHIRGTTVPGYSCFSRDAVVRAVHDLLETYVGVRLKDPNGNSGVGQSSLHAVEEIDRELGAVADRVREGSGSGLAEYLATYGYVVEAEVADVEAYSVTVTRTPEEHYSSFGRLLEPTVATEDLGVINAYGGTSVVVVRGEPEALAQLPEDGVVVDDPVLAGGTLRLSPTPGIVHAAQRYIEGIRLWEADGGFETRANVDVITGTLVKRSGARQHITASVEESGRVGGASPAELLGILALQADPDLPYAVRSTRHSFDDAARTYARHASTVPGSRVFWDGVDEGWDGKYVFIGAF
ncbi:DUF3182 family protein [Actinomycetospora sp. TBRC 11914]|uniref:DUF3182 family protein n=1 Tax=Actinomycetospora sp. TBRC 11914 TaxID=2729387 RepID=UPI00145DD2ED|nr:DUF3182 family protein [Actinomycetospora sp. TBRC 11914]NMO92928.1 DUF3182 family protein [Actinomycetospora sp. TBRC 11914]